MGIEGLWHWYDANAGYDQISVRALRGKYIAVDAMGLMYQTRATAKKKYTSTINPMFEQVDNHAINKPWISRCLGMLSDYMRDMFIPVLVFDSPDTDPLKITTMNKRSAVEKRAIENLTNLLIDYEGVHVDDVPEEVVQQARKYSNLIDLMPRSAVEEFIDFFRDLGFPWVQATGEGERTCALMNRQDVVYAAICRDGDFLACGGLRCLKDTCTVGRYGEAGFVMAELDKMLDSVTMNIDLFQELCIICGTDFNKKVYRSTWPSAIALLLKYRSITLIGKSGAERIEGLNHREVRKRFAVVDWLETVSDYCLDVTFDDKKSAIALQKYGLIHRMTNLVETKTAVLEYFNAQA